MWRAQGMAALVRGDRSSAATEQTLWLGAKGSGRFSGLVCTPGAGSPSPGLLLSETWESQHLQHRRAPAWLGAVSPEAQKLRHWLTEKNSVAGKRTAGISLPPRLGSLGGRLHLLSLDAALWLWPWVWNTGERSSTLPMF